MSRSRNTMTLGNSPWLAATNSLKSRSCTTEFAPRPGPMPEYRSPEPARPPDPCGEPRRGPALQATPLFEGSAVSSNPFCNEVILSGAERSLRMRRKCRTRRDSSVARELPQNDESLTTPKGPLERAGDPHIGQKFHAVASTFSSVSHAAYRRACIRDTTCARVASHQFGDERNDARRNHGGLSVS